MKKHYFFYETFIFLLILILFICPSVLQNRTEINTFTEWPFPLMQLIYFSFALFLYFCHLINNEKKIILFNFYKLSAKNILIALTAFVTLILISLGFQVFGNAIDYSGSQIELIVPENIRQIIFCLLTFIISAGFEEILFRYILPESMLHIFTIKISNTKKIIISEILTAALFGLCHRYLGVLSVLNAACAHCVFRFCYKKTGSLSFNFMIHLLYNITNVFLYR